MGRLLTVIGLAAAFLPYGQAEQKPLSSDFTCKHPPYTMSIVSKSPLVLYLHDFITAEERAHLQEVTKDRFWDSGVYGAEGEDARDAGRTSQSASLYQDDVSRCIEQRALDFQGYDLPKTHMEPLQVVKYGVGEQYHFHTDWLGSTNPTLTTAELGGDRISSFFAYIHVANDTTGGGTNFPMLDAPRDERWCRFIDCDEPYEHGVTFRPVEGSAVYWENLLTNGVGDERTLHAGLPVVAGQKMGMNIWTRQAPLSEELRGTG